MFKGKNKAKQNAQAIRRAVYLDYLETAISAAEKIEDPAEKYLKLRDIDSGITEQVLIEQEHEDNYKKSGLSVNSGMAATLLISAGILTGGVLHAGALGGLLIFSAMPVAWSGGVGQALRDGFVGKKLQIDSASGYLKNIKAAQNRIAKIEAALIGYRADEMAESPLFDKVLEIPGLSRTFADVVEKKAARQALAAEKSAAEKRVRRAQKPQACTGGYDKFKTLK